MCDGWYKHLCIVSGWQGIAFTHIELCAEYLFLMAVMEQGSLFNLGTYSIVYKTGQCIPSKKYRNSCYFTSSKAMNEALYR